MLGNLVPLFIADTAMLTTRFFGGLLGGLLQDTEGAAVIYGVWSYIMNGSRSNLL